MRESVEPVNPEQIDAARTRLAPLGLTAPLVECPMSQGTTLRLKLENLQPVGSYKIRPVGNAVLSRPRAALESGLYTTSSGNSALAVAWMARRMGVGATAIVPSNAPETKLDKLRRLGTRIDMRTPDDWWRAIEAGVLADQPGLYVDAVRDPASLAGDGTIGMEILSAWPEVEAILVPFGGGGLACGVACAVRAFAPHVKIIACELQSAHPLLAAFEAGAPVSTPHAAGFVSGVGYGSVLPEMWPLLRSLVDAVITVTLDQVAHAIRYLVEHNRVVAEGAGAVSVAAALWGGHGHSKICAVVSGGNIDRPMLETILAGRTP